MKGTAGSASSAKVPILIAVMGITGSGKSTFIAHCTDEEVPVGHQLESHTQEVTAYLCKFFPEMNVHLIDTPGFDDTSRDDGDVLRDIAEWSTRVHEEQVDLRGIIYLHRITDDRMQGAHMKNLGMFKKLVGRESLKNVILATTMWESVSQKDGSRREKELQSTPKYWKDMIEKHGSYVVRHQNSSESAKRIITHLLKTSTPTTYAIQDEMVNQGKSLDQTSAGEHLFSLKAEVRERLERRMENFKKEMIEAQKSKDKEAEEEFKKREQETQAEMARMKKELEKTQVSLEKLHKEKEREWKAKTVRFEKTPEELKKENEQLKQRLASQSVPQQIPPPYTRWAPQPYRGWAPRPYNAWKPPFHRYPSPAPGPDIPNIPLVAHRRRAKLPTRFGSLPGLWSITLWGPYYFFSGPNSEYYCLPPKWQQWYEAQIGTTVQLWMGPNDTFVRRYIDFDGSSRHVWDDSLDITHPGLCNQLNRPPGNDREHVSLGNPPIYCQTLGDLTNVDGPTDLQVAAVFNYGPVERVWFGYGGSWVLKRHAPMGTFGWSLKGHYGDLETKLKWLNPAEIHDLALNVASPADWVLLLSGGRLSFNLKSRAAAEAVEAWVVENR